MGHDAPLCLDTGGVALSAAYSQPADSLVQKGMRLSIVGLGSLLSEKKRYREALKAYQRAADIDPSNRDAVFSIVWMHDMLEDASAASMAGPICLPASRWPALLSLACVASSPKSRLSATEVTENSLYFQPSYVRTTPAIVIIPPTTNAPVIV